MVEMGTVDSVEATLVGLTSCSERGPLRMSRRRNSAPAETRLLWVSSDPAVMVEPSKSAAVRLM